LIEFKDDIISATRSSRVVDSNFFSGSWSVEKAWCLGLIATDGCLFSSTRVNNGGIAKKGISLISTDKEMIEKFANYLSSTHTIGCVVDRGYNGYGHNKPVYQIHILNSKLYDDLVKLGLKERKSLDLQFLNDYPEEFMRDYIRGCWDGDGGIYYYYQFSCCIVSSSYNFITHIDSFLSSVLCFDKHTISNICVEGKHIQFKLNLTGENARKLCRYIYHDKMGDAYLTRKYNVWLKYDR